MAFPRNLSGLTTREAIADAVYRAIAAWDENDASLLESAMVPDCVFEVMGQQIVGLDEIKQKNFNHVAAMDTTHFITNMRIDVKDDAATTASLTANALAQHYPTGTGATEQDRRLLIGSKYCVQLVKDENDGLWKAKHFELKVVWREGDRSVLVPS